MQSINLTAAFVFAQFVLIVIVFMGIWALRKAENEPFQASGPATELFPMLVLGFALLTLGILIFSEDLVAKFGPLFSGVQFPSVPRGISFFSVFLLDLLGAAFLIFASGGSRNSPFLAILFVLPTLAIFLRESPQRFIGYSIIAAVFFGVLSFEKIETDTYRSRFGRLSFVLVTLGCLILSTLVGWATRPTQDILSETAAPSLSTVVH